MKNLNVDDVITLTKELIELRVRVEMLVSENKFMRNLLMGLQEEEEEEDTPPPPTFWGSA